MYPDNIFGDLITPERRAQTQREARTGVKHGHRISPADPRPGQPVTLTLTTAGPQAFDAARATLTGEGAAEAQVIDLRLTGTEWDTVAWDYVQVWEGVVPPQPAETMVRYQLAARRAGVKEWVYADNQALSAGAATEFAFWVADDPSPAWAAEAIVYHVFLDRFNPGEGRAWQQPETLAGFYGGTLRGVLEKLEYIAGLGFNAIWLSPLFASPSHHGYDATDYYQVEPRLGTNADLHALIAAAHARGLRVILDFVANHWSHLHSTFQSARTDPDSPYRDWYTWRAWPDDYEAYFGVRELPQLNLKRGGARDYLLTCAQHWLRAGVDGFRLDYAYGPPHDFWSDFRRACREARPDCWLFGEVINTPTLQTSYQGRMDGTLDFLLATALRETFGHRTWSLERFDAFLTRHEAYWPADFGRPAFLDNHDMNRFLFVADEDPARVKLAALVLFTLAGAPVVYNGTEVGVTQERSIHQNDFGIFEEARQPMKWGAAQNADLREYFRRLIGLRREWPVLRTGARRTVHLDAAGGAYAYLREGADGRALTVVNTSAEPRAVTVAVTGLAADALNNCVVRAFPDHVVIELPPQTGALLLAPAA